MSEYPFEAPELSQSPVPPMEAPTRQGSAPLGILGGLLGALVGVIPWFIASTFASFFVGWLGFLVGWAACWGYRKLGGLKSTAFATTVVIAASFLALLGAEFASWMYILCTDPGWQADAVYYGVPVGQMAFESLLMPENWPHILPSLIMGMLIGLLGVFSARGQMLQYTDPEKAARLAKSQPGVQGIATTTGMPLPQSFTLRMKSTRKAAYVIFAVAGIFFLLFGGISLAFDTQALPIGLVLCLIFVAEGFLILMVNKNYRLEVNGSQLRFVTRMGKAREFSVSDIGGVSVTNTLSRTLYGRDGQVLAKVNQNMENMVLLNQYLVEHSVPLRGA